MSFYSTSQYNVLPGTNFHGMQVQSSLAQEAYQHPTAGQHEVYQMDWDWNHHVPSISDMSHERRENYGTYSQPRSMSTQPLPFANNGSSCTPSPMRQLPIGLYPEGDASTCDTSLQETDQPLLDYLTKHMNFYDPSFPAVEALSMSTTPPPVNQFKVTRSPSTSSSSSSSTSTSSVKSRVGTQSQRTAAAQRRIRAAPYTCPRESCGASFTSLHNMRSHEKAHTNQRDFACGSCDRLFTRLSDLRRHNRNTCPS